MKLNIKLYYFLTSYSSTSLAGNFTRCSPIGLQITRFDIPFLIYTNHRIFFKRDVIVITSCVIRKRNYVFVNLKSTKVIQSAIISSKLTIETLEQGVKYVQS